MNAPLPRTLTIAGSDSGGGAGIQADLKTMQELGAYGMSVLTALTAQDTIGVHGIHEVPPAFVRAQLDAVAADIGVDAAKTGMLANAGIIAEVAEGVRRHGITRLVVDPVAASKHGDPLLRPEAVDALKHELLPLAALATPNLGEVALLTGIEVTHPRDLHRAAEAMMALGPAWVLVKGGHLPGNEAATDLLSDGDQVIPITAERLETRDTHGTGDTLASAITVALARGDAMPEAVRKGKDYVTGAIRNGLRLGKGIGPLDHAWHRRAAIEAQPSW